VESIISYAGLDGNMLWSQAARLFAHDEDLPKRYRTFLPLFPLELIVDMPYERGRFACDDRSYHRVLSQRLPMLYAGENRRRCFDQQDEFAGGPVTVDQAWIRLFPQYQPFAGDRLCIYMIGGGHQAVALPESLYPRAGALVQNAENSMGVTERCRHYSAWLAERLEAGDPYDAEFLEESYLTQHRLQPVCVRQRELGRVLQEISVMRDLHLSQTEPSEWYTESAKQSEHIPQYVPFRCACDCFEPQCVTRDTARLMQLHFEDDRVPGDLWLAYQDASEYMDRRRMLLDVRALCEGFQIAPTCDPEARGGVYPDHVRVAVVRDRSLTLMVAETLNNPAYGSGMNPQGRLNRLIYLPNSAELLKRGQLGEETHSLHCKNDRVSEKEYLHMRVLAEWQEHKGRLIDAMYRRESALGQTYYGTRSYDRARDLLDSQVERLSRMVADEPPEHGQRSGYDADIDYLRRKAKARAEADASFVHDFHREHCIESGYAMRSFKHTYALTDLTEKTERTQQSKPARNNRMQAANGQWFEQVSMFGE